MLLQTPATTNELMQGRSVGGLSLHYLEQSKLRQFGDVGSDAR